MSACPYHENPEYYAATHIEQQGCPATMLEHLPRIVGEGRKGGESATKTGNQYGTPGIAEQVLFFRQTKEKSDDETSDNVDDHCPHREVGVKYMVSNLSGQIPGACAEEAS